VPLVVSRDVTSRQSFVVACHTRASLAGALITYTHLVVTFRKPVKNGFGQLATGYRKNPVLTSLYQSKAECMLKFCCVEKFTEDFRAVKLVWYVPEVPYGKMNSKCCHFLEITIFYVTFTYVFV